MEISIDALQLLPEQFETGLRPCEVTCGGGNTCTRTCGAGCPTTNTGGGCG
ncbi:hypothetical protein Aph01nite_21380 [Acrocarpospora phusangensis]|uniref:Lantibiotic n=2 Tax=Acrocarpospora phusangensis TaxID=1070424 RepID=A0A919Q898_9ACTN|nr:hypothetical protein Aph01nite_21380 [Acrocarpospora phusangensis]